MDTKIRILGIIRENLTVEATRTYAAIDENVLPYR